MICMPLGIYISVPFCRTKCSYCNFASDVFSRVVFERYVDRICSDIENAPRVAAEMGGKMERAVDSIYLGGGTPTVLEAGQLERIFGAVRREFEVNSESEVTVECAPGTLTSAMIAGCWDREYQHRSHRGVAAPDCGELGILFSGDDRDRSAARQRLHARSGRGFAVGA
jgi:coproporphyrinogen III oxidase-like Fe-S oxidoreductase